MSARSIQGRLAAEVRHRPSEDHTELKRDLAAAKLEDYITRTVDAAPPLSVEQRDRLAVLLRGAPPGPEAKPSTTGGSSVRRGPASQSRPIGGDDR